VQRTDADGHGLKNEESVESDANRKEQKMKKVYITPETEVMELVSEGMIADSLISSEVGIGYGGVVSDEEVEIVVPQ